MPAHSAWKGFINLSLVSVAVKAFTASTTGGGASIRLNQLHRDCNNRIKHQKTCPEHGAVPNDEIVMGYEYAEGQYVVIDLDELDKLRAEDGLKSINIDAFVEPGHVDPLHMGGASYYLVPDGAAGQKPYALLHRAMLESNVECLAQVVLQKREHLVLLRALPELLVMTVLKYSSQLRDPGSLRDDFAETKLGDEELSLAKELIRQTTKSDVDIGQYKDQYQEKLAQLIEAKVKGEEIVTVPSPEPRTVINLMDQLKASVLKAREASQGKSAGQAGDGGKKATQKSREALKKQLAKPAKKKKPKKKSG